MKWQDISTAPKDGQQILTYRKELCETFGGRTEHWYQTSFWSPEVECFIGWPNYLQPTHWHELPEPPK